MAKKIDIKGIRRIADRLAKTAEEAEKAADRARSTLRRRIAPEARRDIQQEYNIKARRVTAGLTARNLPDGVELIGSKRGVGAIEFDGKWRGRKSPGATWSVRKGKRTQQPGSFIAPLLSGNPHIVERTGRKRRMTKGVNKGLVKETLFVHYGPSVAQMLRRPGRAEHLADFAQDILAAEIERLLR